MLRAAELGIARELEELSIACDAGGCAWGRGNWAHGGRIRPLIMPAYPLLEREAIPAAVQAESSPHCPLSSVLGDHPP